MQPLPPFSPSLTPPSDPFQRLPELLGRLPLPSEVWGRASARLWRHLPEPVQDLALKARRLPLPRLTGPQLFAAVVPAGLMLGWLASFAVDPQIMQRGGKPYAEVISDGVRVELAYAYDGYPEDPAPFGYPDPSTRQAEYLSTGIAGAGDYADLVHRNLDGAPLEGPADDDLSTADSGRVPLVADAPAAPGGGTDASAPGTAAMQPAV